MLLSEYDIELEQVVKKIIDKKYKTIGLQIPEGLKSSAFRIVNFLREKTKTTVIVIADPCYGACDVANNEYENLGVEFILHVGHTPIPNIKECPIPTDFINALSLKDINTVVKKSLSYLVGKNIGILTTSQHLHKLNDIKRILEKNNFNVIISEGDKRISYEGQILGCNFSVATEILDRIDSYLFIGGGNFHPLGLLLNSKKPVIVADPFTNTVRKEEIEDLKDSILRQRYGAIANSKNSNKFGILVSTKRGQQRIELVNKICKLLEKFNKEYLIISIDYISPNSLSGFREIDCFISTACPRIAIDDYLQYKKPIITPIELEILLDIRKWEDYEFDQII